MLKTPLTAPIGYKNPMSNNVTHETAAIPEVQDFRQPKCRKSEVQPIFCQKGQLVIANRSCFTLEILRSSPFDKIFLIHFVILRNTWGRAGARTYARSSFRKKKTKCSEKIFLRAYMQFSLLWLTT